MTEKIQTALQKIPLFENLSSASLLHLVDKVKKIALTAGETLFQEGDLGDSLYFIQRGQLEVFQGGQEGKEKIVLATLKEGEYFGEMAILEDEPRSATVRARMESEVFRLCRDDLQTLLKNEPGLRETLEKTITARRLALEKPFSTPALSAGDMNTRVFISYSRRDKEFVQKLDKAIGRCVLAAIVWAVLLVFVFVPQAALACEPTPILPGYIPPTPIPVETQVASVIQDAQIVLDGTVKSWVAGSDSSSILTVEVEQYLKGHGPRTVKISGYFWVCAPNFAFYEGSRAIFFVNGDPSSPEPLQVHTWFDAQEVVVTGVRNFTGQQPTAPDSVYGVLWLGLPVIVVLGLVWFMRYRRTHPG